MRTACTEVLEKPWKALFSGAQKDGIGVQCRLVRKCRDVQAPEADEGALATIVVGNTVRAIGVGDVHLHDDEVWIVVQVQWLNVLVGDHGLVVWMEIRRERRKTEWRKQRVLHGPPLWIGRLLERGKDEPDLEGTRAGRDHRVVPADATMMGN